MWILQAYYINLPQFFEQEIHMRISYPKNPGKIASPDLRKAKAHNAHKYFLFKKFGATGAPPY